MGDFFKPGTTKTTQESKGTSTQEGKLDPKQEQLNKSLFDKLLAAITQGPVASQSNINQGRTAINDTYDATGKNLESNLAARGFSGPNGKLGKGFGELAIARNKAIATSDATEQNRAMQEFQQMISNAFQFNQPRSYTSTTSGTNVNTQPGPSIFDRILGYAGQGIGGAAALGYCWVARALYGENDSRVALLRAWLPVWAQRSPVGALFVWLYLRYGESAAVIVKRNPAVRAVARFVFDRLLWRAQYELSAVLFYSE